MRRLFIPIFLILGACNSRPISEMGPPPSGYRAEIVKEVRETFYDPHSIQDAEITKPFVFSSQWTVCLKARAKNQLGGYIGLRHHLYFFEGNQLTGSMGINAEVCDKSGYTPFPELT